MRMICSRCKIQVDDKNLFCYNCGNNIQNCEKENNNQFSKGQKVTVISMLSIILLFLFLLVISDDGYHKKTRTVMIYVVGSNLETDAGIVSNDLAAINSNNIDLKTTNVLLYTGGTEKWHNFISNEDNGIYVLESSGFKKIESQQQLNLGNPNTLTSFLKFSYEEFNADIFDLILYNHGGAIDGAIYDDISNDNLSLEDMKIALKNSPFNAENKMESILFRTCLNGTIELSNIFKDYANYLIGSEEVSYGSAYTDVLGFLNDVTNKDGGLEYGIKFVNSYEEQMKIIDPGEFFTRTYSVIDLSKISKINEELDKYIASIDIVKNYNAIAKIRANIFQYGSGSNDYDMVDLYNFVVQTKKFASENNQDLLRAINDAVVYNKTNENNSHGLSIYFPYNGRQGKKDKFISIYSNLDYSKEYQKFITKFNSIHKAKPVFKFELSKNETEDKNNEISIQLTKEQISNYSFATFTIFERDNEHPDYYRLIHNTDEIILNTDGLLIANYKNKLVKIKNDENGYEYILTFNKKSLNNSRWAKAIIYNKSLDYLDDGYSSVADLYFSNNSSGDPIISTAKLISDNERIDGIILNLDNYDVFELLQYSYRILDDNGNVISSSEWERAPIIKSYVEKFSEMEFKYSSLDGEKDYYGMFTINDINGHSSYSKLIKIGE